MVRERGHALVRCRSRPKTHSLPLALLTLHLLCGSVHAQLRGQVVVGFDGAVAQDHWNPATLTVTNEGQAFRGTVRAQVPRLGVSEEPGTQGDVYTFSAEFPPGETTLPFVLWVPDAAYGVRTQVVRGDEVVFQRETAALWAAHCQGVTLVLVSEAGERAERAVDPRFSSLPPTAQHAFVTPREAPRDARAYEAAEAIVLGDVDLGQLPPAVWAAIRRWTATGGLLVLTAPFLARNASSPELSRLAGVSVVGRGPADGLGEALGLFSREPVQGTLTQALDLRVPALEVLASTGGHVLAFERPVGLGTVRGVAVDPAWSQTADWPNRARLRDGFWAKALARARGGPGSYAPPAWSLVPDHSRLSHTGLPLFIALLAFVVVAGPLNCAVVGVMRRKELVVVTTPAIVLLFVVGLTIAAVVVHSPLPSLAYQTTSVMSAGTEGIASVAALGVFSPGTRAYDLTFTHPEAAPVEYSPFSGAAGPHARSSVVVSVGEPSSLSRVEIERWSMRVFVESTFAPHGAVDGELSMGPDGLAGAATNRLPFALQDCYVIHRWNHARVGDLLPGERRPLTLKLGPPSLSDYQLSRLGNLSGPSVWLGAGLWPGHPEGRRWEQLGEGLGGTLRTVSGPFLLGWGQAPVPPPELRERHSTVGNHPYIVPLRTTVRGPDLVVPLGGAFETVGNPRSAWLATYPTDAGPGPGGRMPEGMPGMGQFGEIYGTRELLLPIEGVRPEHRRLVVHGQLSPRPAAPAGIPTVVCLYDWERRQWTEVGSVADPTFAIEVEKPSRFILWPPGIIRVAAGARRVAGGMDPYGLPVAWVDVEYVGRGGER